MIATTDDGRTLIRSALTDEVQRIILTVGGRRVLDNIA